MLNQLFIRIFRAHLAPSGAQENSNAAARGFASFVSLAVLGALALGVLPASAKDFLAASPAQTKDVKGERANEPGKINTAPLKAWIARTQRLKEQGKLDVSKPQELTIEGDRDEAGLLSNVSITGASAANANFKKVAQDFAVSLNQSHALNFLQDVSHVRMAFTLEGGRFKLHTTSDTPSETRATEMARGYRSMINIGRIMKRGGAEAVVLNNMKVSASGKQLVMNLDMPREAMESLLLKQITPN